ncbi:hypothetical protein WJX72_010462 [[Myrmecia] bisecta]|uniref:Mitochondrial import receptor subunit TOM20 n=1 Tax=[Myrmecia] bisecta TaxID=41462 RepID=A0AAW1PYI6_9CHLO
MEQLTREELERLMFFEQAREAAEHDYNANNRDAGALTRWGGALLELAHVRQGNEAAHMIEEAVEKFRLALAVDAKKHDTLWCLGNAYTSQGFLTGETVTAQALFDKATDCFKRALAEDPTSEVYQKGLEMTSKAPALHAELQRQMAQQGQLVSGGGSGGGGGGLAQKKSSYTDFWYDVGGWVCFAGICVGMMALARSSAGAPPPALK